MEASTGSEQPVRVLGLGNEILADDAFGILVAREVERRFSREAEVMESSEAGFNLLDRLINVSRLLVVDTMLTGKTKPGTMQVYDSSDWRPATGLSPHFTGLFEVLAVAKELGLRVPHQVTVLAVEAADCFTIGGAMHPEVRAAIPLAVEWVWHLLESAPCATLEHSG